MLSVNVQNPNPEKPHGSCSQYAGFSIVDGIMQHADAALAEDSRTLKLPNVFDHLRPFIEKAIMTSDPSSFLAAADKNMRRPKSWRRQAHVKHCVMTPQQQGNESTVEDKDSGRSGRCTKLTGLQSKIKRRWRSKDASSFLEQQKAAQFGSCGSAGGDFCFYSMLLSALDDVS